MTDEFNRLTSILHSEICEAQEEMLERGKMIISDWLSKADADNQLNEAVDWLFYGEGSEYIDNNIGAIAFKSVQYAIEQFCFRNDCESDDYDYDSDENDGGDMNPDQLYDDIREWFGI